jgi:protein involved in sex pheromone biosynthesis
MTKRILMKLFAVVLTLAITGQAFAQEQASDQVQTKDKNGAQVEPLVPQQCFSSGAYDNFLKVCITNNGNISWFESPAGSVHLQSPEGYGRRSARLRR